MKWKLIEGFPTYWISSGGDVARAFWDVPIVGACTLRFKHLKPTLNHGGYPVVALVDAQGKRVQKRVHLLVLEAFVGTKPSSRHVGAHAPDRDRKNCALANLRWALPEENEADKRAHGTEPKGGRVVKLKPFRVERIRSAFFDHGESFSAIARREGLHRSSVARICKGERRADVQRSA